MQATPSDPRANSRPPAQAHGGSRDPLSGLLPGVLVQVEPCAEDSGLHLHGRGLDPQQDKAVSLCQSGQNIFLTGMAGTGKSHTLLSFIGQSYRRIDACATTGIAALNLQDQFIRRAGVPLPARTIYSYAGIGLGPAIGQTHEAFWTWLDQNMNRSRLNAYRRIRSAECLVIDEISMLPGRILDYLDFHFRRVRDNDEPFGGIQIIAVGDFCQLPPVAKNGIYDWAFLSRSWRDADFQSSYLTQIHRQADPDFVEALNAFRLGNIPKRTADLLSARVKHFVDRRVPRLMTHNSQVEKWNCYQLGEIERPESTFEAIFAGPDHEAEFLKKNSITPAVLTIKPGCRVMVTANLTDPNNAGSIIAVNGQCGTVYDIAHNSVSVLLDGEEEPKSIAEQNWQFDPQREESARMTQIPLRLAYAMTIHKSQGLTLDRAHIDIRAAREPGQAYVALSRLKSLRGLYLKEWIKGVSISEAAINFYRNL